MPMTLKADIAKARQTGAAGKPVDLVHLSAQTFGDPQLEAEVLRLFLAHAPIYLNAWLAASGQDARKQAAHTLKGAARGIGAWRLAELAGEAELPGFNQAGELQAEFSAVCEYIRSLG